MRQRLVRVIYNRMSISSRIMFGSYLGTPLQAALPFRFRCMARLLMWLRVKHHE